MVKKVQIYAEKVAARYDPYSNPVLGLSLLQHSQKLASMHWEMKGHGSHVNLWEALHASQDHVTRVLWFPNVNKRVYFNP